MNVLLERARIQSRLNSIEISLRKLRRSMEPLLLKSKQLDKAYDIGFFLSKHKVGGRIYLKWRYNNSNQVERNYVDLSSDASIDKLSKLPGNICGDVLKIDYMAIQMKHKYMLLFAERTSLRKQLPHYSKLSVLYGNTVE